MANEKKERALPPPPQWAKGLEDLRHVLRWDDTQYICNLGVGNKLIHAIVDTGAHRTVIDSKMAAHLGLRVGIGPQSAEKRIPPFPSDFSEIGQTGPRKSQNSPTAGNLTVGSET